MSILTASPAGARVIAALSALPMAAEPAWAAELDQQRLSAPPRGGYMPSRGPATAAIVRQCAGRIVRELLPDDSPIGEAADAITGAIWGVAGPDRLQEEAGRVRRDDVAQHIAGVLRPTVATVRDVVRASA